MIVKIICIAVAAVLGMLGGNGAVYVFNHMPAKWLTDYGEEIKEDVLQRQRLNSYPWKYVFSGFLIITGIGLASFDPFYCLAVLCTLWCMIIVSCADAKYMILPDQFLILIAVCGFGFINYHEKPVDLVYGALLGAGIMLFIALISSLITRKEAMGFGDVKLMGSLGMITGVDGIILVIIGMSFLSCIAFCILLARKKIKRNEYQPLAPYICAACAIYMIVIWPLGII